MAKDGNGDELQSGDRVWTYDLDGTIIFGTLLPNIGHEDVSEWYVKYEDGAENAVLDFNLLFRAEEKRY